MRKCNTKILSGNLPLVQLHLTNVYAARLKATLLRTNSASTASMSDAP